MCIRDRYKSLFHPVSSNCIEPLKNTLSKFLLNVIFPTNSTIAKRIFIIVGFKYKKIVFLKKMVSPPNIVTSIAPKRGT